MTGKYPARLQLTNFLKGLKQPPQSPILTAKYRDALPLEEITVAELLQSAGYATGHFGKWHLGEEHPASKLPAKGPASQGFAVAVEIAAAGPPPGLGKARHDKNTAWLTDRAIEFISTQRDKPFFCYLPYHTVHIPLEGDDKLVEKYHAKAKQATGPQKNPLYAAMVEEMDFHIGRLLAKLEELRLTDNTLVIFTSDNGGLSVVEGPHTPATTNLPLRDGKGYLYEGGIRVPLIVRWPGKIPAGSTCDVPVMSVDWLPTLLNVCGTEIALPSDIDGVSIDRVLAGTGSPTGRDIFWHYPHFANQGGNPTAAIRSHDWKLIEFYEDGKFELYDLASDPGEAHDLAMEKPETVKQLHKKLIAWRNRINANMPMPNPSKQVSP